MFGLQEFVWVVDGIYIHTDSDSLLSLALEFKIADSDISVNDVIMLTLSRSFLIPWYAGHACFTHAGADV